jgi:hypothetical protein
MTEPQAAPIIFRRIQVLHERVDAIYMALHIALIIIFAGLMVALWTVREDIIKAIERN